MKYLICSSGALFHASGLSSASIFSRKRTETARVRCFPRANKHYPHLHPGCRGHWTPGLSSQAALLAAVCLPAPSAASYCKVVCCWAVAVTLCYSASAGLSCSASLCAQDTAASPAANAKQASLAYQTQLMRHEQGARARHKRINTEARKCWPWLGKDMHVASHHLTLCAAEQPWSPPRLVALPPQHSVGLLAADSASPAPARPALLGLPPLPDAAVVRPQLHMPSALLLP